LPPSARIAQNDWMLLEVADPAFQAFPASIRWQARHGRVLTIVGYPGGAGRTADQGKGHYWGTGHPVEPATFSRFRIDRSPEPGMLKLRGPDETRAGMSGGGVFDDMGVFVGIHRSAADSAMSRDAIAAMHIQHDLATRARTVPVIEPTAPQRTWKRPVVAAALVALTAGVVALVGANMTPDACRLDVVFWSDVLPLASVAFDVEYNGRTHSFQPDESGRAEIIVGTKVPDNAVWQFTVRSATLELNYYDTIRGCPTEAERLESEHYHVTFTPR